MSDRNPKQRINIKFCMKISKRLSETLALLQQAYVEHSMKKSSVFEWHRRFEERWEDVHHAAISGQPNMQRMDEDVDRVRPFVRSDQIKYANDGRRIEHEQGNSAADSNRGFVNEQNFSKDGTSSLDRSASQGDFFEGDNSC
ncbi:unnamed protein product [Staurois parvus]|uniref:Mos1 transposase HTH domain-containing protein n=1 Tax=Staurois parvus TaxID=386267 RepID=A0ABN9HAC7_9NEOB|nr:unnamed protein product [Staurois parvus]